MKQHLKVLLALALAILGGLTFLLAQSPVYTSYIWIRDGNGHNRLVPVTQGITVASDGRSVTISGQTYQFGFGLTTADVGGVATVVVDSAAILYRVQVPTTSGDCSLVGSGASAVDTTNHYECAPNGAGSFEWVRWPVEKDW